jgi:hypothetical protein
MERITHAQCGAGRREKGQSGQQKWQTGGNNYFLL